MSAKIHIERLMHRSSIAVAGERAAGYALIKVCYQEDGEVTLLPLTMALVLDVSGSMYQEDGTGQSRLQRIQNACLAAVAKLKPQDSLAVVIFAHDAQVVLPSTPLGDREVAKDIIRRIDTFAIDPGGTAMDKGLALGLQEVEKEANPGSVRHVVVLADGESSAEESCRRLAQQAAEKKVYLTMIGVGTEWNGPLLKDMARLSGGKWRYIDVDQAQDAERIFEEEMKLLPTAVAANLEIVFRPVKEVRIKRIRQVVPEIKELPLVELGERHLLARLGTLEKGQSKRYILEMSVPRRPDGKYVIAPMEMTYASVGGKVETNGVIPLEMQYTSSGQGYVNAEVAKHIDEVQLFELNNNLQKALGGGDLAEAERLTENIARKGELLGPRATKKTMLAKQVLDELHQSGRVCRKTQIAIDDVARLAEEVPLP